MCRSNAERQVGYSVQSEQQQHDTSTLLLTSGWSVEIDTSTLPVVEGAKPAEIIMHLVMVLSHARGARHTGVGATCTPPDRIVCLRSGMRLSRACPVRALRQRLGPQTV